MEIDSSIYPRGLPASRRKNREKKASANRMLGLEETVDESVMIMDSIDSDTGNLDNLIKTLRTRATQRNKNQDSSSRTGIKFRKKLTQFERENVEAFSKLRMIEPQLARNEEELEKIEKENKKLEKKNRALIETQRVYEIDMAEKEQDLRQKEQLLKRTEAQSKKVELEQKRKMEEHQRRLKMETEQKIAETTNRANKQVSEKDDKLSRLRGLLDKTSTNTGKSSAPLTPLSSASAKAVDFRVSRSYRRTMSESKLEKEVRASSTPSDNRKMSKSDLRLSVSRIAKPTRPTAFGSLDSIVNPNALTNQNNASFTSLQSRGRKSRIELISKNPRNESTISIQKRRSSSADQKKWLAHTPDDTIHTNTVLQNSVMLAPEHVRQSSSLIKKFKSKLALLKPAISSNKRVHRPSVQDLKKSDRYLLTHQEQNRANQLKTTLFTGNIVDTKNGGIQVMFTGKERLTTANVDSTDTDQCHLADMSVDGSETSNHSSVTDVAVRCGVAVVHDRGSETAHILTNRNRKRIKESQTNIRIVEEDESLNNGLLYDTDRMPIELDSYYI